MMLLARKIMIQDLFIFTDVYMAGYIAYTCTPIQTIHMSLYFFFQVSNFSVETTLLDSQ